MRFSTRNNTITSPSCQQPSHTKEKAALHTLHRTHRPDFRTQKGPQKWRLINNKPKNKPKTKQQSESRWMLTQRAVKLLFFSHKQLACD